jgi:hypothetical protein
MSVRKPTIPTKFGVRKPPQLDASRHRGTSLIRPLNALAVMIPQGRDGRSKAAREGLATECSSNYVVRRPSMALQASSASPSVLKGEPTTLTAHLF